MSDISLLSEDFCGHPVAKVVLGGQEWLRANDLSAPLEVTRRSIQRLVAQLPDAERCDVQCRTSSGTQAVTFVSFPGALQVCLTSRSPLRSQFVRMVSTKMMAERVESSAVQAQLSAQTTALQALHAQHQKLAAEVQALKQQRALPVRRTFTFPEVPQHEAAAFDAAWQEAMPAWGEVTPLVALCLERRLLPSLLDPTMDVRGHGIRLGRWLAARPDVDKRRTTNGRRIVRLAS